MTLRMLNIPLKTTAARIKSGFGVSVHKTKRVCQPWTLSILILIKLPMKPQVKPLASSRLAGLGCVCPQTLSAKRSGAQVGLTSAGVAGITCRWLWG